MMITLNSITNKQREEEKKQQITRQAECQDHSQVYTMTDDESGSKAVESQRT